jgi:outer membrane protein TolC
MAAALLAQPLAGAQDASELELQALATLVAAVDDHPALAAARASLQAAQRRLDGVSDPISLSASYGYTGFLYEEPDPTLPPLDLPDGQQQISVSTTLRPFLFGDLRDLADQRQIDVLRAALNLREARAGLEAQAVRAAASLLVARAGVELARAGLVLAGDALDVTDTRFARGAASAAELERARLSLAQAESRLVGAEADQRLAEISLELLVGAARLERIPELAPVPGVPPAVERSRLDLALAELTVRNGERGLIPTVQASYAWNLDDDNSLSISLESRTLQPTVGFQHSSTLGVEPTPTPGPALTGSFSVGVGLTIGPELFRTLDATRDQRAAAEAKLRADVEGVARARPHSCRCRRRARPGRSRARHRTRGLPGHPRPRPSRADVSERSTRAAQPHPRLVHQLRHPPLGGPAVKALMLSLLLLLPTAAAQTLADALAQADGRLVVVNALLELDDSRRALERTRADPLALRFEQTQAQQRVLLAEAQLEQTRFQAYVEITQGYTQLLQAQRQLELAEAARVLSAQALDIARIRLERGSATALDLQDAETSLNDAINNVGAATQGVALARSNLQGLTGLTFDEPAAVAFDFEGYALPPLEQITTQLERHPTVLQATQGLELARLGRELLDPSYAAANQIEAAELQISQAEGGVREARRGLDLQARSLHNAAVNARQSLAIARESLTNSLGREQIERQRLEAGLIADIAFRQTQLATRRSELALLQAEHSYLKALLDLQAGAFVAIEGLHGF